MTKIALTDELLLAIAACLDLRQRFTSVNLIGSIPGDPRLHKYRRLAQQYLHDRRERQRIQKAWHHLKRSGYLQKRVFGQTTAYLLTLKGEQRRLHLEVRTDRRQPRMPNGTWLMVLFDIPESLRKRRDALRQKLRILGFEQLQKSVWVTTYEVREELTEVIKILDLESYARSLIVHEITK